jgi:hypothetical protein
MEKPEGKRRLGRSRHRWADNIKMNIGEVGRGGMNWTVLAPDRGAWRAVVNMVMNLWIPQNVGKLLSSCINGIFSRRMR